MGPPSTRHPPDPAQLLHSPRRLVRQALARCCDEVDGAVAAARAAVVSAEVEVFKQRAEIREAAAAPETSVSYRANAGKRSGAAVAGA